MRGEYKEDLHLSERRATIGKRRHQDLEGGLEKHASGKV